MTEVVGVVGSDGTAPEHALNVHSACRVVATSDRRIVLGVSLEVDVERVAATHAGALLTTCGNIVRAHESESGVLVSRVGSSQVAEGLDISGREKSGKGLDTIPRVGSESSSSVGERHMGNTKRLLDTRAITLDYSISSRGCGSRRGRGCGNRGGADSSSDICGRVEDGSSAGVAACSSGAGQSSGCQSRGTLSSDIDYGKDKHRGGNSNGNCVHINAGGLSTCQGGKGSSCDGGEGGTHLGRLIRIELE